MTKKLKYLKISLDYFNPNLDLCNSLKVLPEVESCVRFFPEDPALANILLLTTSISEINPIIERISTYEGVSYVEQIDKPELR